MSSALLSAEVEVLHYSMIWEESTGKKNKNKRKKHTKNSLIVFLSFVSSHPSLSVSLLSPVGILSNKVFSSIYRKKIPFSCVIVDEVRRCNNRRNNWHRFDAFVSHVLQYCGMQQNLEDKWKRFLLIISKFLQIEPVLTPRVRGLWLPRQDN